MIKRLFFHIGSPKAASTFLQLHVFPKSPRFIYLSEWDNTHRKNNKIKNVTNFIDDLFYAEQRILPTSFFNFNKFLKESASHSDLPILISYEYFTARALKHIQIGNRYYAGDLEKAIERLKGFGINYGYEVNIIFIQREFREFVFSSYAQLYWRYRKLKPTKTIKEYLKSETGKDNFQSGLYWFYGENMRKLLEQNFGLNKVHIFSFDDLMKKEYTSAERVKFENLVGVEIGSLLQNVENKRSVNLGMRIATLTNPGLQEVSFYKSLSIAFQTFREYFIQKKGSEKIVWDKQCEDLCEGLEVHFKNYQV
jgi:hypothetical protein